MKPFRRLRAEEDKLEDTINDLVAQGYEEIEFEEDEASGHVDYFAEVVSPERVPAKLRHLSRHGWTHFELEDVDPDAVTGEPRKLVTAWKRTKVQFVVTAWLRSREAA